MFTTTQPDCRPFPCVGCEHVRHDRTMRTVAALGIAACAAPGGRLPAVGRIAAGQGRRRHAPRRGRRHRRAADAARCPRSARCSSVPATPHTCTGDGGATRGRATSIVTAAHCLAAGLSTATFVPGFDAKAAPRQRLDRRRGLSRPALGGRPRIRWPTSPFLRVQSARRRRDRGRRRRAGRRWASRPLIGHRCRRSSAIALGVGGGPIGCEARSRVWLRADSSRCSAAVWSTAPAARRGSGPRRSSA